MTTTQRSPFGQADLTNCDQELIHLPGQVQAHGLLLVLDEPALTILQISSNTSSLINLQPESLLGLPLSHLLPADEHAHMQESLERLHLESNPLYLATVKVGPARQEFHASAHRLDGLLYLELEPALPSGLTSTATSSEAVREIMAELLRATDLATLSQVAARRIRALTGHDRAWVYRFHPDHHGEIIAEDRVTDLPAYFGLHYPATDIPLPARQLYLSNWIRLIPNAYEEPAALVPATNSKTGRALDMTFCTLRAVSPFHIEYVKNMGCSATMSISLIHQGKLWGLISCNSAEPRNLPLDVRTTCELLGQMMSLQLGAAEAQQDVDYKLTLQSDSAQLISALADTTELREALPAQADALFQLIRAEGLAVVTPEHVTLRGSSPDEFAVRDLVSHLSDQSNEPVVATDALAELWAPASDRLDRAAGLLAIQISNFQPTWILWFRPEFTRTVQWGADPNKEHIERTEQGLRLSPRKSFDLWKETVRGRSQPWLACEVEAARNLRNGLLNVVLRRAEALDELNRELALSNIELDAFAYVASHDLKEPLRGIHNYSSMLLEDYGDRLDAEAEQRLLALVRLTRRMEDLLDALLNYSRLGRRELHITESSITAAVSEVRDMLRTRIDEAPTSIEVLCGEQTVSCDPVLFRDVLLNLISNALKYNDKPERRIEIGTHEHPEHGTALFVRDNGIGIPPQHYENVFRIFRRLHAREAFGGGTGAGLTIVKKIVERHNGQIWLDSTPGEGTTFFFTLGQVAAPR
ncbi:MAG: ATP-binding protein [Chloroflexota bacterium]